MMQQKLAESSDTLGGILTYLSVAVAGATQWFVEVNWIIALTGIALFIRVLYDGLRLYRYATTKKPQDGE